MARTCDTDRFNGRQMCSLLISMAHIPSLGKSCRGRALCARGKETAWFWWWGCKCYFCCCVCFSTSIFCTRYPERDLNSHCGSSNTCRNSYVPGACRLISLTSSFRFCHVHVHVVGGLFLHIIIPPLSVGKKLNWREYFVGSVCRAPIERRTRISFLCQPVQPVEI